MKSQQDPQMCKPRRNGGACLREEAHREEEQNPAQTPGECQRARQGRAEDGVSGWVVGWHAARREEQVGSETGMKARQAGQEEAQDREESYCCLAGNQKRPLPTWVRVEAFPTWGSNLVLHTRGTEGGLLPKSPGLSATYSTPPPLTLSPPGV